MKKIIFVLLGWILFMNVIDLGTSYYGLNNLAVEEAGILGVSNAALIIHFGFSLLIMGLCYWLVKKYYDTEYKSFIFKLFIFMLFFWAISDAAVAINNISVILKVTQG